MTRLRQVAAALNARPAPRPACCAAVTCQETVQPGRIFCPNHWFFLPKWLRTAIVQTFQDGEWTAHQDAVSQAADHIDAAFVAARDAGFEGLISARAGGAEGDVVRYFGKGVA